METKFQTSFIPKKPMTPQNETHHAPSGASVLMIIGVLLFVVSLAGAGFTFLAKSYLLNVQEGYKKDLADNEKRFNVPLIEELKKASTKIDLAKKLIANHIAVSEALNIIAGLTAEKVYFSSFEFNAPDIGQPGGGGNYKIKMQGVADSFNSIAFQSDVFGTSEKYGTNKVLKNPILSDLLVDEAGNVKFNFTADITPADVSYDKTLTSTLQSEGTLPSPTAPDAPVQ